MQSFDFLACSLKLERIYSIFYMGRTSRHVEGLPFLATLSARLTALAQGRASHWPPHIYAQALRWIGSRTNSKSGQLGQYHWH